MCIHGKILSQPLDLSSKTVHVICLKLDLPRERWVPLTRFLTADERTRADRFRVDEPRRQFTICRATLRRLLSPLCHVPPPEVPLICGNHGKPELARPQTDSSSPRIEFNVSHSGELGLIALTTAAAVGIDIEEFKSKIEIHKLAERFFSPQEAAALARLPPEKQMAGFYRGWTCKEAYIKTKGQGLSLSLSSFCVELDPDLPATLCHVDDQPDEPAQWTTQSLDVGDNYAAAVMVARPNCEIASWTWPEV